MSEITLAPVPPERGPRWVQAQSVRGPTHGEKVRRLAIAALSTLAVVAACLVLAGYAGKEPTSLAASEVALGKAPLVHPKNHVQALEDEIKSGKEGESKAPLLPDPAETTKQAQEAMNKASETANQVWNSTVGVILNLFPDVLKAWGWHLDLAIYVITVYIIYYIWNGKVWHYILPKLLYVDDASPTSDTAENQDVKISKVGAWADHSDVGKAPSIKDLLWFRLAKGEVDYFSEKKMILPGLVDTIMCGCGGNARGTMVTNKRIILQNDKRCLFGTTDLTTNEESIFLKDVHTAVVRTDGSLKVGFVTLHSADMLSGGFNWFFIGFVLDIILESKAGILELINDDRVTGWVNLVPNDILFMINSFIVLYAAFLFMVLLFFFLYPQSVLEIEFVQQAGIPSYTKKIEFPVRAAYKAYDAIMLARVQRVQTGSV